MSKLEELVTPSELLVAIKEGARKQELTKKYKTSEQELAMMLLPLYRGGELTKEEFNDFFKGASLKKTGTEDSGESTLPQTEVEAPSEILQSLSRIFGKKPAEPKPQEAAEAPATALEPEPKAVEAAAPAVAAEPPPPIPAEPAPVSASEPVAAEEMPDFGEPAGPAPEIEPEPEAAIAAETREDVAGESLSGMDSAEFSSLLNSIFAKLNSIDRRLAEIEKKVSGQ